MAVRFLRAAFTACAFVLTLSIPAIALADACDDAWNAYEAARAAAAEAINVSDAADAAAAAAPGNAALQQAAKQASDALWEANNEVLRKRNATDNNCWPPRKFEAHAGRVYHGTPVRISVVQGLKWFFGRTTGPAASGFGAPRASALQAAPAASALSGVVLSVVGSVEFTRAFGATTPAFLGGLRAAKMLNTYPAFVPFGEILAGIEHCGECQTNDFALEFGFGTEYRRPQWDRLAINGRIGFRTLPGVEFAGVQRIILGGVSYRLAPR